MQHEVYAHKDFGVIDLTALLMEELTAEMKIGYLEIKEFLFNGSGHEYDEERLIHFRRSGRGLFNPCIAVMRKIDEQSLLVDVIDGWHRMKVLNEIGKTKALFFIFEENYIRKFVRPSSDFSRGNEVQEFLDRA